MSAGRLVGLLLWKNWLVQRRRPSDLATVLVAPLLLVGLVLLFRDMAHVTKSENGLDFLRYDLDSLHEDFQQSTDDEGNAVKNMVVYSPTAPGIDKIMKLVGDKLDLDPVIGFASEEELLNFTQYKEHKTLNMLCAVVFSSGDVYNSSDIVYKLRFPKNIIRLGQESLFKTKYMYPVHRKSKPREKSDPPYLYTGFLAVQRAVDEAIIKTLGAPDLNMDDMLVSLKRFPYPPYEYDRIFSILMPMLTVIILFIYSFGVAVLIVDIVHEKEKLLKEYMEMLGLDVKMQWATWFLKYMIIFLLLSIFISVIFKVELLRGNMVLRRTDASIVFLFLFLYSFGCITFSFLVSAFFRKASRASLIGWLINFLCMLPFLFVNDDTHPITMAPKVGLCFSHNMAMGFGWRIITDAEKANEGLHWSTLGNAFGEDSFNMGIVLTMLLFDGIIYGLLAYYFESIIPSEYGISKPWYFVCKKDFWRCGQKVEVALVDEESVESSVPPIPYSEYFEPTDNQNAGVKLRNLTKIYKKSEDQKPAVDGATIDFHENEISILLGRSGAGKTTTLSMISGVIQPTAGSVLLNDVDVTHDIANAQHCLGVCLQESVFFDKMTVEEHLIFIARLRGIPDSDVDQHVQALLEGLDLSEHRDTLACKLSGGWKRKLAIAVAFVGDPKVVILDEPSTGIDPEKRNQLYQFLQRKKEGRIIIVSTHALEEADLIGDRIAVMADGVIHCFGSTLFLKGKYGCCYYLVMKKNPQSNTEAITAFLEEYISGVKLCSESGSELKYSLPQNETPNFEKMLNELDSRMEDLFIASYSISATTLEEVFMQISCPEMDVKQGGGLMDGDQDGDAQPLLGSQEASYTKNVGAKHFLQQLRAMLTKRFLGGFREKTFTISQVLMPLFFIFLASLRHPSDTYSPAEPLLELSLTKFPGFLGYYTSDVAELGLKYGRDLAKVYEDVVKSEGGTVKQILKNREYGSYQTSTIENFILHEAVRDFHKYENRMMIAADFMEPSRLLNSTASRNALDAGTEVAVDFLFNFEPLHTPAMVLNAAGNVLLRFYLGTSNTSIVTYNDPLPPTVADIARGAMHQHWDSLPDMAVHGLIGFSLLLASFAVFIVKEWRLSSKHLQLTSGTSKVVYWMGHFLWDFFIYLLVLILMLVILTVFGQWNYVGVYSVFTVILLNNFIWAGIPLVYFLTKAFNVPATAYNWIGFLLVLIGYFLSVCHKVISALPDGVFTLIMPNVAIFLGLFNIKVVSHEELSCHELQDEDNEFCDAVNKHEYNLRFYHPCCPEACENCDTSFHPMIHHLSWGDPGIGHLVLYEILVGTFWILILSFFESNWWRIQETVQSIRDHAAEATHRQSAEDHQMGMLGYSKANDDEDVTAETQRIWSSTVDDLKKTEAVLVMGLKKKYGNKVAVNNVTFGVQPGECFGLLGANGAGKTTIFEVLTRRTMMSSGQVFISGHNILTDSAEAYKCIGYCPQVDHLLPFMTPKETLYMYARIRGLAEEQIPKKVEDLLKILAMDDKADERISHLSYGARRRVSLAVAIIGEPPILLLDEPTSGLDPVIRKRVWTMLGKCQESGQTLILTSHSMVECEALCTRIAILINGEFKCLGNTQHLKTKFGQGYSMIGKIAASGEENVDTKTQAFVSHINDKFSSSILQDVHQGTVQYRIPTDVISLAQVFGVLERSKESHGLVDYCVSQATLEQVFMFLVRSQIPASDFTREGFTFAKFRRNLRRCFNMRRT